MLMNVLRKSLHEEVIPEIKLVRAENTQIKTTLEITKKRLDDRNVQLADQSHPIDETNQRIAEVHTDMLTRIDVTNQRIDAVHSDSEVPSPSGQDRLSGIKSNASVNLDPSMSARSR